MNDTFSIGENVFVLVNDRTAVVECKIVAIRASGCDYAVEPIEDRYLSRDDKIAVGCNIFRSNAKAWYAVAQKWAAIRDVAEANRARAVDLSIA